MPFSFIYDVGVKAFPVKFLLFDSPQTHAMEAFKLRQQRLVFPGEQTRLLLVKVRRVHLPGGWEEGLEWPLELANQIIYFGFARNELQHG